jgi:uncharacterized protein YxjI
MKPRLIIQQKLTAFVNKYNIYEVAPEGSGSLLALAQQKRFSFKEKVLFYTDEKRDKLAFTFRAEKVMDVHGRYFVEDANGALLGMFKKEFVSSLVSSTWKILDANGTEQYLIKESNLALALLRRFGGELPFVGGLIELLVLFFKYHFVFIDLTTSEVVGTYTKTTLFRDHYLLEATDDLWTSTDWRVLAAMGVGLDALQSR